MKYRTCVGIDTHSTKNEVFALDTDTGEAWRATLSSDPRDLGRFLCSLPIDREGAMCVYEAGPTGFGLARALATAGWGCVVAATSKLPQRIDAEWLARCLAAGAVRPVSVSTAAEESLAHLSRLRRLGVAMEAKPTRGA